MPGPREPGLYCDTIVSSMHTISKDGNGDVVEHPVICVSHVVFLGEAEYDVR